jgi:DNA-binding Xre family transcriptional regulator
MTTKIYTITPEDAGRIYSTNGDFRNILQSGCFLYIEGSYVIDAPNYVHETETGVFELTAYAREHLSECALAFDERVIFKYSGSALRGDELRHSDKPLMTRRLERKYNPETQDSDLLAKIKESQEAVAIADNLPNGFSAALIWLMEQRDITEERLAETARVSSKTIQRMRTNAVKEYEPGTVVAVCVGLQLFPRISYKMLDKAGIAIRDTERDYLYSHILDTLYKSPIYECNKLLEAANYPPLTKSNE